MYTHYIGALINDLRAIMNIQLIFDAIEKDQNNSALGIITEELERQSYSVLINGVRLTSKELFEGVLLAYEIPPMKYLFEIERVDGCQKFCIEFDALHQISIHKAVRYS